MAREQLRFHAVGYVLAGRLPVLAACWARLETAMLQAIFCGNKSADSA